MSGKRRQAIVRALDPVQGVRVASCELLLDLLRPQQIQASHSSKGHKRPRGLELVARTGAQCFN
jgi:hypothetical protein